MLTAIYIEALLIDEELANLFWEAEDAGSDVLCFTERFITRSDSRQVRSIGHWTNDRAFCKISSNKAQVNFHNKRKVLLIP